MKKNDLVVSENKIKDQLLQVMIDNEGSDIYITVGTFPGIKISGEILRVDEEIEKFTPKDTQDFAESLITHEQRDILLKTRNLDFSFSFGARRFRGNVSFQLGNYMVVLRLLSAKIPSLEELHLPDIYSDVCKVGQGLILVTGPTGSGKSTTLASMIDYINSHYEKHIITIEDPVEYVHEHKKSIIEHKEIGRDILSYSMGLKGAMRQNPQVILFGEMRTKDEIEMALTLAETGHLVFSTLHTRSASQTISRIIDSFESANKNQVRLALADSLVAVFSQRLLRTQDGLGVRMAKEILYKNGAVANLIRENDLPQIQSVMQMGSKEGMQLLEVDIISYVLQGVISEEEGLLYANNPRLVKEGITR